MAGAVAQLGERLNGIQEVVGSIPISSTKIEDKGRSVMIASFFSKKQQLDVGYQSFLPLGNQLSVFSLRPTHHNLSQRPVTRMFREGSSRDRGKCETF